MPRPFRTKPSKREGNLLLEKRRQARKKRKQTRRTILLRRLLKAARRKEDLKSIYNFALKLQEKYPYSAAVWQRSDLERENFSKQKKLMADFLLKLVVSEPRLSPEACSDLRELISARSQNCPEKDMKPLAKKVGTQTLKIVKNELESLGDDILKRTPGSSYASRHESPEIHTIAYGVADALLPIAYFDMLARRP